MEQRNSLPENLDISVKNTSVLTPIKISLGQTEPGVIALPSENHNIAPGETLKIPKSFEGGCAKLFVWSEMNISLWCGVVPLGGDTPILVDPDSKQVTYRGQIIPSCETVSGVVKREDFKAPEPVSQSYTMSKLWYGILVLSILIALYLVYLNFGEGKSKTKK